VLPNAPLRQWVLSVDPPSRQDLQNVVDAMARRVTRMLARRGLIGEARHDNNEAPSTSS
jgi:hypothetical protein